MTYFFNKVNKLWG